MTITYRGAGAWGAGKGSNLTAAEVDGNFYDLNQRLNTLEAALPAANDIASFDLAGNQLSITLEDDTVFGPKTLTASQFTFRGNWAAAVAYAYLDVVRATGGTYVVNIPHTSSATFDPDELSVDNLRHYNIMSLDAQPEYIVYNVATTDELTVYSPTVNQVGGYFRFSVNSPAEGEFKIPANVTVPFPVGTEFTIVQRGTQPILIWADGGDDIYSTTSSNFSTDGIGTVVVAKKISATEWELHGEVGSF